MLLKQTNIHHLQITYPQNSRSLKQFPEFYHQSTINRSRYNKAASIFEVKIRDQRTFYTTFLVHPLSATATINKIFTHTCLTYTTKIFSRFFQHINFVFPILIRNLLYFISDRHVFSFATSSSMDQTYKISQGQPVEKIELLAQ